MAEDPSIEDLKRKIAEKEAALREHLATKGEEGKPKKKKVHKHGEDRPKSGVRRKKVRSDAAKRRAAKEEDAANKQQVEERAERLRAAADKIINEGGEDGEIKWKKMKLLGAGSFGKVYLANNEETGDKLAVKLIEIALDWAGAERMLKTVQMEITALRQLIHPNIVMYYGCGKVATVDDTLLSLSVYMEFVAGGSLNTFISRHGRIAEGNAKLYTAQIVDGLAYLHTKGLVHRDLKPDNLLLEPFPWGDCPHTIKIADFGASRELGQMSCTANKATLTGTPHYMAPEVMQRMATQKADVWSLGATLYHMLAGAPPWNDVGPMQMLVRHSTNPSPPPWPDKASEPCIAFLASCMTFDYVDRPTAEELFLDEWLEDLDLLRYE